MLKDEIEILVAIFLNKRTYKQIATGRLNRRSPYIMSNIGILKKKGYIVEHQSVGYSITDMGIIALGKYYPECVSINPAVSARLRKHLSEATKAIKRIERLSSDYETNIGHW